MRGLFRGLTPRVIQTIPTMSIMMMVYDGLNRFILRQQNYVDVSLWVSLLRNKSTCEDG